MAKALIGWWLTGMKALQMHLYPPLKSAALVDLGLNPVIASSYLWGLGIAAGQSSTAVSGI